MAKDLPEEMLQNLLMSLPVKILLNYQKHTRIGHSNHQWQIYMILILLFHK